MQKTYRCWVTYSLWCPKSYVMDCAKINILVPSFVTTVSNIYHSNTANQLYGNKHTHCYKEESFLKESSPNVHSGENCTWLTSCFYSEVLLWILPVLKKCNRHWPLAWQTETRSSYCFWGYWVQSFVNINMLIRRAASAVLALWLQFCNCRVHTSPLLSEEGVGSYQGWVPSPSSLLHPVRFCPEAPATFSTLALGVMEHGICNFPEK